MLDERIKKIHDSIKQHNSAIGDLDKKMELAISEAALKSGLLPYIIDTDKIEVWYDSLDTYGVRGIVYELWIKALNYVSARSTVPPDLDSLLKEIEFPRDIVVDSGEQISVDGRVLISRKGASSAFQVFETIRSVYNDKSLIPAYIELKRTKDLVENLVRPIKDKSTEISKQIEENIYDARAACCNFP